MPLWKRYLRSISDREPERERAKWLDSSSCVTRQKTRKKEMNVPKLVCLKAMRGATLIGRNWPFAIYFYYSVFHRLNLCIPETKNIVCRMYAQATADILQLYIVHTYARSMFPYAPRMLAYVLLDWGIRVRHTDAGCMMHTCGVPGHFNRPI